MLKQLLATAIAATLAIPSVAFSQEDAGDWDVTAQHAETTKIDFMTDEGTWMSLDVSPDGSRIVFDMLGDLYVMPITGGEATLLSGGPAYETQPRYSPDGTRISFTSDRAGSDNLWTMAAGGGDLKQITDEKDRQVSSAIWTPDGQYLIGRKHYRNTRSLGAGEMWLYHIGGGEGLRLTERPNWEQNSGEPALSPDGRYLYYSEDVSPGGGFQYNRDPYSGIYAIKRLDRETGEVETFIRGPGGAIRPEVSPDGETLSFIRRVGLNSVLFVQDIESGRETALFDGLSHDQQEAWSIFGVYPSYDWTPDGENIIIYGQGKIWRIDAETGDATQIPFQARVQQTITEAVRFPQEVAPETFDVKMLRWVTVAPDGRSVIYNALGKLWLRPLTDGEPRRITGNADHWELHPSFSPDGGTIVYTTWDDEELGAVWTVQPNGTGARKITTRPGHYVEPEFSPDGRSIVFRRIGGDGLRGDLWSRETGIYIVPAAGGEPRLVTERGSEPMFSADGQRIFVNGREDGNTALVSVDLNGGDRRVHLTSENAEQIVPSPDGKYVAWVERYNAFVAPLPMTGQPVSIGPNTNDYPVQRISRDAGNYLHWSPDGRRVYWSLGPELYTRDLGETWAFAAPGEQEMAEGPEAEGRYIGFSAETAAPSGTIALVGATAITMDRERVIPNATIVVTENRITAVGPANEVAIPANAKRVDVSGKYVMPGIIDVHAHYSNGSNGIAPETNWGYYANLAYGVTTMHNPSSGTEMVFSNSELVKAGKMVAPRLFSTGTILYGAEGGSKVIINSYEDALSNLRRLKKVGAFTVKSYNLPRREQRQQVVEAARELEMMVVPEGGSTYYWNMAQILDGHTGIEHNIPIAPLYKDALTLISSSETGYTPTLVVNFGGLSGEFYWYQESNVWENERLLTFTPREMIDARSRRRPMAAEDDYFYKEVSATANVIEDMGGSVQLGAHGQLEGLAAHWELWMFGQGGMTPMEALQAATIAGAEYLGLDGDLGSIEEGKLADLVVMDRNPLENLRNSESVSMVMANGQLFDAATMNLIGNHPAERPTFYWER
ncbi:MAG TPA: amidohydrolase family protein [Longimicrobiaceae bacterium]|nr:amidohydrolase family protein [Longimicrobiaceae bacterium]